VNTVSFHWRKPWERIPPEEEIETAFGTSDMQSPTDRVDEANRRRHTRHDASIPIAVQAVTSELLPIGASLDAFTMDLSQSGVRFFLNKPMLAKLAIVRFVAAGNVPVKLLAEIRRCKRVGSMFDVAVQFLRKLSD
jgi:hypothetical protein